MEERDIVSNIAVDSGLAKIDRYAKWLLVGLFVMMLILPLFFRDNFYLLHLFSRIYLNGIIVLGLVAILGFSKQFSLGQVAFYGIGAYTTAVLTANLKLNFFLAFFLSGMAASAAAILVAIPATRFRGPWLALVTFGFAEIIRILMIRMKGITGGFAGFFNIPKPSLGGFVIDTDFKFYYVFFLSLVLVLIVICRIRFSPIGRMWICMGDQEDLASSLGINLFFHKLSAFAVGSFFAGLAGSLYAGYANFISPPSFTLKHTIYYLSILVVGGLESIPGALVATVVFTVVANYLIELYPWDMVLFGLTIIVCVNLLPGGIGQKLESLWRVSKRWT